MTQTLNHMIECGNEAIRVARGIGEAQLDDRTTLPGWDVRTLVNHVIAFAAHGSAARAQRRQLPPEIAERDFTALASWRDDFAAAMDDTYEAWRQDDAWIGEIDSGGVLMPASQVAGLLIAETALHTWDLAVSTGQRAVIGERAGEYVAARVADVAALYRRYDGFGPEVNVAPHAPAFERALGLSGRDPGTAGQR